MQIIPAIDIRKGKCVRLIMGDVRDETVYSKEPVDVAKLWQVNGARLIHVVDLDGALTGTPKNIDIILKIAKSLKIKIEVGGGIRDEEIIKKYIKADVKRVILSTSALAQDGFLEKMIEKYKDRIVVGVDAKDGKIAVKGWRDVTNVNTIDFIKDLEKRGVKTIIYTDINRDGVLKGPNIKGVVKVLKHTRMRVIVSGGVTNLKNVQRIMELDKKYGNIEGIIVGKAIYTGAMDLKEAIRLVKDV
ncbi:MAG: 1-(5-phosphoribosyl)-5-[(5-phosphoribosylamino)methylideneamino]imidazole-4-carboxamide isomerase [Spirochaetia bacterium]|nr:1-(5-phosphoribosyl)-5-[(5-phosphoribosylamino)methylideneamino]imidazole-4-carboxamide isomerase [Spirochaetia bacterium]